MEKKNTWAADSVICSEENDFKGMQAVKIANKFPFIADDMCVEIVSLCFFVCSRAHPKEFSSFFHAPSINLVISLFVF